MLSGSWVEQDADMQRQVLLFVVEIGLEGYYLRGRFA